MRIEGPPSMEETNFSPELELFGEVELKVTGEILGHFENASSNIMSEKNQITAPQGSGLGHRFQTVARSHTH
ncbi:hypothetical protein TWF506_000137 [Arthrobotrys conoides]|uniref:Uncharacterized protein n=1 Tax=Arthrobotrys conoides TaxID=74498 RepID=A0AAN8S0P2_9PEZI